MHEAYERLVGMEVDWNDRVHFFAVAARAMRRILVDHAKARRRAKLGGGQVKRAAPRPALEAEQRRRCPATLTCWPRPVVAP